MSDTIQVVRIDDDIETRVVHRRMEFWHEDEQQWFSLGDVIELTERMVGRGDPVWPAKFYISKPVDVGVNREDS